MSAFNTVLLLAAIDILVAPVVVMWCSNVVLPSLFVTSQVTYTQAFCLNLLAGLLFKKGALQRWQHVHDERKLLTAVMKLNEESEENE